MRKLLIPIIGLIGLTVIACNSDSGSSTNTTTPNSTTNTTGNTASNTTGAAPAGGTAGATAANFSAVASIASSNCMPCHAADKHRAGVDLSSYAGIMKGGEVGPIVKAGDPDNSIIVKAISGGDPANKIPKMPPQKTLTPAEIQTIKDWIKAGAKQS